MKKIGVVGEGKLIAWTKDDQDNAITLVVAWNGYGENPGSRYSGLYSYYPAETTVYTFHNVDKFNRRHFAYLIGWKTRMSRKS